MATSKPSKEVLKAGVKRKQQLSSSKVSKKRKIDDSSNNKKSIVDKPKQLQDYSSNWKLLQQSLPKPVSTKAKKRPINRHGKKQEQTLKKENVSSKKPEIWFDDVDEALLEPEFRQTKKTTLVKEFSFNGLTKAVAMDCEMVGTGADGVDSILARVSIVNQFGHTLLDKYVKPRETVTDYRTHVSGIRPSDLIAADEFTDVQRQVSDILKGRILVGHALHNDLKVLYLDHPRRSLRDTSRYKPFRALFQGRIPSLKKLSDKVLGVKVQEGEHNSVQDAQAAMRLYTMHKKHWEAQLKSARKLGPVASKLGKSKKRTSNAKSVSATD